MAALLARVLGPVEVWRGAEHVPLGTSTSSDEAARVKFPDGWRTLTPYLRIVPQPR